MSDTEEQQDAVQKPDAKRKPRRKKAHRRIGPKRKTHYPRPKPSTPDDTGSAPASVAGSSDNIHVVDDNDVFDAIDDVATDYDYCPSVTEGGSSHNSDVFSASTSETVDVDTLSASDIDEIIESASFQHLESTSGEQLSGSKLFHPDISDGATTSAQFSVCYETIQSGLAEEEIQLPIPEGNDAATTSGQLNVAPAAPAIQTIHSDVQKQETTSPILGGSRKIKRRKKLTTRPVKSKLPKNEKEEEIKSANGKSGQEQSQPLPTIEESDQVQPIDIEPPLAVNQEVPSGFDEDSVCLLVAELQKCLPAAWLAQQNGSSVRIVFLTKSHNASVEKSLYWDSGVARMYLHNLLVPQYHQIYKRTQRPPITDMTINNICVYLSGLVMELEKWFLCMGIRDCESQWHEHCSKGHVGSILFEEDPCLRSLTCELLLRKDKRRCSDCQKLLNSFRSKEKRKEERSKKDQRKIPNKYLHEEELREKLSQLQRERKYDKKKINRLIDRLKEKKDYVKVDQEFHRDFLKALQDNEHKMTDLQKLFWLSQMNALKVDDRKSVRWHPMMIRVALCLQDVTTNAGYETLRNFIALPSKRRLYDYSHVIQSKEGCQKEIINDMKEKVKKAGPERHFKYVNLMCDEMHVRSGLVLKRSTGELIGYTNLSEVESELRKLTDEMAGKNYQRSLAKKALVYFAEGITSSVFDVVAVYSVDDLSASQLYTRSWDVIYNLEEADIGVLTFTFDGAAVNRKFIEMHTPLSGTRFIFCTHNLASGEERRPLFFILDPPHLMKTARNCLANSFSHKKTRMLWKNGQYLSWKSIEELFKFTSTMKFTEHNLTKAHIKLTSFSCMKVIFAVQVFSTSVAMCLERYQDHDTFKDHQLDELIELIKRMDRFFDCMNAKEEEGKEPRKPDLKAYRSQNDERFDFLQNIFLQFFEDWKDDVNRKPGCTQKEKSRMMISHQTIKALKITVHSFIGAVKFMLAEGAPKVNGRVFNQDPLEQYFGKMRQSGGDDNNPTMAQLHETRTRLHTIGNVAPSCSRGNTQVEKRTIEVDDTPLPALKRLKK